MQSNTAAAAVEGPTVAKVNYRNIVKELVMKIVFAIAPSTRSPGSNFYSETAG